MINKEQSALNRLFIAIRGIATRTVSRLSDLIGEMQATGAGNDAIRERITPEIKEGIALSEMRAFANARAPGFIGDMVFRFARDTLAEHQKNIGKAFDDVEKNRLEAINKKVEGADGEELTRLEEVAKAYEKQGIDISAFTEELPEPPPDAPLTDRYMWVSVVDKRTCSTCAGNHGKVHTLGDWSSIGEPRSGACAGEQSCRCILIPITAMTKSEQSGIRNIGPLNIPK